MYKSYDDVLKLRISDMQILAMLARGVTQTEAAEDCGTRQPRVSKVLDKIEAAYGLTLSVGTKSYWKLTEDGIRLGKHFEDILGTMKVGQTRESYGSKIAELKIALNHLSEQVEKL